LLNSEEQLLELQIDSCTMNIMTTNLKEYTYNNNNNYNMRGVVTIFIAATTLITNHHSNNYLLQNFFQKHSQPLGGSGLHTGFVVLYVCMYVCMSS
jgi:hypothetical protein